MTGHFHQSSFGMIALASTVLFLPPPASAQIPVTGPETEKRFPPLKLAEGFESTLFACDPLVEYPSVIALGPRPGTLFVAQDYMTGLGKEIVKRDEIRLIEDTDGDGYADKTTLFAEGFNSIQGLAYDIGDGTVFAMHAPFLTRVRDTDGDGVADERRDLLEGLGLRPEENDTRLHTANGVTIGHDGWLYLSMGDHGAIVDRPEGGRLVLEGGGILRCRADGTGLHIFSTGLRNIYDVALDADLNVFVRDNENDGGDYKIRVYHTFFGADHGYPYNYYERPGETMLPLADLDLGSSAGGVCYLETAFPERYRGNLFFCDWNHSLVRYEVKPKGASFEPMVEYKVAEGGEGDLYPFKPSDVIVDWDGSLLVSDWADGQRPKRGRARIYRITHRDGKATVVADPAVDLRGKSQDDLIEQLDSSSYYARVLAQKEIERRGNGVELIELGSSNDPGRGNLPGKTSDKNRRGTLAHLHGAWILAHAVRTHPDRWVSIAASHSLTRLAADAEDRARIQAIRSTSDLFEPGKSGVSLGHDQIRSVLRENESSPIILEILTALGRLGWKDTPQWIGDHFGLDGAAIDHAAAQALRRSENWPAILDLLDLPEENPLRTAAVSALAEEADVRVVDDLLKRMETARPEYVDLLARVHRKPGPWVYWEYRPAPRPPNAVDWERTEAIGQALDRVLAESPDTDLRQFTLQRMLRENIPVRTGTLSKWLDSERNAENVALILDCLREKPAAETSPILEAILRNPEQADANRLGALESFASLSKLSAIANSLEDGPVLAAVLLRDASIDFDSLLSEKIDSSSAVVRAAAITALGERKIVDAGGFVLKLLGDPEPGVREAAAAAAQKIPVPAAADRLLRLAADDSSAPVRRESFDALRAIGNGGAVSAAVRDLGNRESQLAAMRYLGDFGKPDHAGRVVDAAGTNRSAELLEAAIGALVKWERDDEIARLQCRSGTLLRWRVSPAKDSGMADSLPPALDRDAALPSEWDLVFATGQDAIARIPTVEKAALRFLASDVVSSSEAETPVQFLAGYGGPFKFWLNGKAIFESSKWESFKSGAHRINAVLAPGTNRIVITYLESLDPKSKVQLRFRKRSSVAAREDLTLAALTGSGNARRGRQLFFNLERSQCLACHRLGEAGGRIGPELTGMGGRFSRIYLIESILDPNANVTPGFKSLTVTRKDGSALFGVKVSETESAIVLGDAAGQSHEIPKADIAEIKEPNISLMPAGLENLYTRQEFLDLMAFLISEK